MAISITTFLSETDIFNTSHQFGAIVLVVLGLVLLGFYVKNRANRSKHKRNLTKEDKTNENYILAVILFLSITITMFIDGLIEILAGILAIVLIVWHIRRFD
jgi:zinc transporter ZupT